MYIARPGQPFMGFLQQQAVNLDIPNNHYTVAV